jgi:DNA-damage-inducible protein D
VSQTDANRRIALFQHSEIRRTIHNDEWWFVISDVVAALTDSVDPQGYLKDMRRRDPELSKGWGQIATPLSVPTSGGDQKATQTMITSLYHNCFP